jgi:DHA1 family tetracycline resistance protein-like MFS transporter
VLLPIFLIVLVDVFALTLVIPLLAIYAEQFGATPFQATLLIAVFAVCQLVSGPVLGRTSDRIGRKPMLLVSQVGTLVGLLVMAGASSLAMVFVGRVIDGCTAGNLSLAQAWIADHTRPEERAKSFALIGIAFGLGFFLGPSVTGFLAQYGLRAPLYAAAAMSATSILCTATLLRTVRPASAAAGDAGPAGRRLGLFEWSAYARYFRRPVLGRVLVQFFAFAFAFGTFTSGFALFAERTFTWQGRPFGPREVGYMFAYAGFLGIILQGGLIGRLVARFGEWTLATVGFAAMGGAFLLLGLVDHVGSLVVITTFAAVGQGLLRPTLTSLVSRCASADEQGVVLGLTQSLGSVALIAAPPLGGWLIGHALLAEWAFVAAAASAVGLALGVRRHEVTEVAAPVRRAR